MAGSFCSASLGSPPPRVVAVDAFYAAGLAHGGADNGAPGIRPDYGPDYYAAFVLCPDGYRIEAHTHQE